MATYESYIRPHQLPPVQPLGALDNPDERFFIRTHQAFEIWFAQILDELEMARDRLITYVHENDVPLITRHVERAAVLVELLRAHLPALESLLTTSFYDFRSHLFGAGGVQSYRFREVEWLLGFRDADLLAYARQRQARAGATREATAIGPDAAQLMYRSLLKYQAEQRTWAQRLGDGLDTTRNALASRERDVTGNGSLRRSVLDWLARTPYPAPEASGRPDTRQRAEFIRRFTSRVGAVYASDLQDFTDKGMMAPDRAAAAKDAAMQRLQWFLQKPERTAIVFILQFADQPLLAWPAALLEALLDLDEALLTWRDRHVAMVERVLGGGRFSTMGAAGSGVPYLQETVHKRAFPEIWDARTFLIGTHEGAGLYTGRAGDWGEWRHYRLANEVARTV